MPPPLPAGPPSLPESPHYPGADEPRMNARTVEGRLNRSLAMLAAFRRASSSSKRRKTDPKRRNRLGSGGPPI
jgi:hypothetical protein